MITLIRLGWRPPSWHALQPFEASAMHMLHDICAMYRLQWHPQAMLSQNIFAIRPHGVTGASCLFTPHSATAHGLIVNIRSVNINIAMLDVTLGLSSVAHIAVRHILHLSSDVNSGEYINNLLHNILGLVVIQISKYLSIIM